MTARDFDHPREVVLAPRALADVAGVDAVLRQRLRAVGILRQQLVAVVVKVTHQGYVESHAVELRANGRHFGRRLWRVDGDPHDFRARLRQFLDLHRGRDRIGRIGVGHRLHDHRRAASDPHFAAAPLDDDLSRAPSHARPGSRRHAVDGFERLVHVRLLHAEARNVCALDRIEVERFAAHCDRRLGGVADHDVERRGTTGRLQHVAVAREL